MILNENEVIDIINISQIVPTWVTKAREMNKELEALVNGVDFISELKQIEHKEDAKQLEARQKYSHSIKDMFTRILRPIDNVYTATGGTKRYGSKSDVNSTETYDKLIAKVSTIRDQRPLEKWLQRNWMKLYHTDPNGVIFYEYKSEKLYPTYKNIGSIRNYKSDGQNLEWILFEPVNKPDGTKEWRFVDDENDYIIIQSGSQVTPLTITDKTFKHPFGSCPGVIISDIVKIGTEQRLSPIDSVIELAKESLRDNSQKSMFKFLLWSPIFWRYALKCPKCGGTGKQKTGDAPCDMCNGLRIYGKKDITDALNLPVPEDKESAIVTPNVAGFIIPPIEIMAEFNKEMELVEGKIYTTIWGSINYQKMYSGGISVKTATEIIYDTAPQIARLNDYADTAQWVEWRLTELAANFIYPSKPKDESICMITYGRNYIIEPMEVLLARYVSDKNAGCNTAILDRDLEEWICSKFKTDPIGLEEELKRLKVEPFIHYTIEQVKANYSQQEAQKKMLFEAWWRNEADKNMDSEDLIEEFDNYCEEQTGVEAKETMLIETLGVGSVQAVVAILTDAILTDEQKTGTLIVMGFTDEQAENMLSGGKKKIIAPAAPAPPITKITPDDDINKDTDSNDNDKPAAGE
jgi:hypothetical protein